MLPLARKGVVDSPLPVAISAPAYARFGDFWLLVLTVFAVSGAILARLSRQGL
jgi:apolipoprotein N-acyltransferase